MMDVGIKGTERRSICYLIANLSVDLRLYVGCMCIWNVAGSGTENA